MSFFEDASLVYIPAAVKNGKTYSIKPTDGTGDLTFTRASNATRVASNGLIEEVRTNLLLQSNTFSTTWTNTTSTETSGQAGYDGTNNAWLLQKTNFNGRIEQTISASGLLTFSVYAKAGTDNFLFLRVDGSGGNHSAYFDLVNGTVGTTALLVASSITAAGNGYYRCSISLNDTITIARIYVADANGDTSGTSGNIYIQDSQLEAGDIATNYIATTTAVVSVGPVSGLPRLDYLNSSCPRILLEPQRTNSVISSENIGTSWTYTNATGTLNQTAAPDGYIGADAIVPNTTSGQHAINSANITASGSFTLSAFVKAGEYTKVAIRESANTGSYASFNLATGTKIEDNVSGASFIQSYGNGWYRIGVTGTFSGTIRLGINVLSNAYTTGNPSSGTTFFAGNGTDKLFCWGMQCELGATYATSYIPTLSTSVTRVADAASKTGISSLIGQTEGTFYAEWEVTQADSGVYEISLSDGSASNAVRLRQNSSNTMQLVVASSGVVVASISSATTIVVGQRYKLAAAYKLNDFVFYLNGTQVGSDSSGAVPTTLTSIGTSRGDGSFPFYGELNQALVFKTRLTNSQLAELTTI